MSKNQSFKILKKTFDPRLDRNLQVLTGLSRKKVKSLLDQGKVYVNGRKVIIASWEIKKGDLIEIREEEAPPIKADEFFLKVIHEDKDLIVVEKDAGIPCESSPISTRPTLVAIINAYLKRRYTHLEHFYLGLVHRLDRETSGLMVYTKTKEANRISQQFKRHTIERKYVAVVEGQIESEGGTIDSHLKKSDLLPKGQKVALATEAAGMKATTVFRVLERYTNATLVEVRLNTGRTHQIRVHMASIGHPVVGDRIYGSEAPRIHFPRQALHASFLGFIHPVTGKKMEFESELPRDLRRLVDRLRIRS